ncbi:hypothetical protein SteCoe_7752 [Stentor coeruleus]|uniref:Arf-GAP domain-containing protein n=1 Tax=Stentor coeruleus TaxID=5963 RepID=A0A1R2CLW9_9CILI|nr:hypothetical protein SteCoe_7752 [Stentor coeruleus]
MEYQSRLNTILAKAGNKTCADCNGRNPRWASISLGVFVCIRCCGLHRALGTHISKMKSTTLDKWTPQMFIIFESIDNDIANSYWEANLPKNYNKPIETTTAYSVEMFLRDKYESKLWIGSGPDPVSMSKQPKASVNQAKKEEIKREEKRPVSTGPIITDLLADTPTVYPQDKIPYFPTTIVHSHSFTNIDHINHHKHSSSPTVFTPSFPQAPVPDPSNPQLFPAFQNPSINPSFPHFENTPVLQFSTIANNQNQGFGSQIPQNFGYQNTPIPQQYGNSGQNYGNNNYPPTHQTPPTVNLQQNPVNYNQVEDEKNKKISQVLSMYGPQNNVAPVNNNSTGFKPLGAIAAQNFFNQNTRSQPYPTF